jgi:hypothetical protein
MLVSYLAVGSVIYRLVSTHSLSINMPSQYLTLFSEGSKDHSAGQIEITSPTITFNSVEVKKKVATRTPKKANKAIQKIDDKKAYHFNKVSQVSLIFKEPVVLEPVKFDNNLTNNWSVSYRDFQFDETVNNSDNQELLANHAKEVPPTEDQVSTTMSAAPTSEETPESEEIFFDYSQNISESKSEKPVTNDSSDSSILKTPATSSPLAINDYSKIVSSTQSKTATDVNRVVTTHSLPAYSQPSKPAERVSRRPSTPATPSETAISAVGFNLITQKPLRSFETKFQDDQRESLDDHGTGVIAFASKNSLPKMTRTMTILKSGHIPTTTDLIMEKGYGEVKIPLIEESIFNKLHSSYDQRNPMGALLVELDDETELAQLDVKFENVITLDGNLRKTKSENFRYQLFIGVRAGNALLTYKRRGGDELKKIIHVPEGELVFDANYYEEILNNKIKLYEEDLLAKEPSPLVISGDMVKIFATQKSAKKLNSNTYKLNFAATHLGGRRYIELNHLTEPVFMGMRNNNSLIVPSENFIKFIISNFEDRQLGNKCLVQVNLDREIRKFEVGTESVGASVVAHAQALDSDGKFYDSVTDKTRKLIIMGESMTADNLSSDAKINIKIEYTDDSHQYLSSYCSPNTYLVEQL